jgi:hypothetical protein
LGSAAIVVAVDGIGVDIVSGAMQAFINSTASHKTIVSWNDLRHFSSLLISILYNLSSHYTTIVSFKTVIVDTFLDNLTLDQGFLQVDASLSSYSLQVKLGEVYNCGIIILQL